MASFSIVPDNLYLYIFLPMKIYEGLTDDNEITHLTRHLTRYYNQNDPVLLQVFTPYEGMPVAAFFKEDRSWHRAQIIKIYPKELLVDIVFVDYGNVETIALSNLRYLKDEFLVKEVATFKAILFGISFKDADSYTKACKYINDTIVHHTSAKDKLIQVQVKNVTSGKSKYSVVDKYTYEIILRYPIQGKLTNINVALTNLGYAECTSLTIFSGEKEPEKINDGSALFRARQTATKLETNIKVHISNYGQNDKILKSTPTNSVLCKVTNAVSPGEIWVQDITHSDTYYEACQKLICDRYKQIASCDNVSPKEWKIGDYCVVRTFSTNYNRAVILDKLVNNKYKLICLDDGCYVENAVESNMFELIDEFKKHEFIAKKCRLVGVLPLGNTNGKKNRFLIL